MSRSSSPRARRPTLVRRATEGAPPASGRRRTSPMERNPAPRAPAIDYRALAELRYHIRKFLRTREIAARAAGVEPQHYLLLLQLKGLEGDGPTTVGALAERLQLRHHTVVELVDRLAARGMVARHRAPSDRRRVVVDL